MIIFITHLHESFALLSRLKLKWWPKQGWLRFHLHIRTTHFYFIRFTAVHDLARLFANRRHHQTPTNTIYNARIISNLQYAPLFIQFEEKCIGLSTAMQRSIRLVNCSIIVLDIFAIASVIFLLLFVAFKLPSPQKHYCVQAVQKQMNNKRLKIYLIVSIYPTSLPSFV